MPTNVFSFFAVALFASALVTGCANGKSNFFPNDGGLEGGTADGGASKDGGSAAPSCADFCTTAAANGTGCDDETKCQSLCKADNKAASNAACTDERNAFLSCAVGPKGSITCSSTKIDITGCSTQKKALDSCLGSGTTDDAGTPPGSCTLAGQVTGDPTCDTCLGKSCCNEWNACLNSTDCSDFASCANACAQGNTTCVNNCATTYSAGANLFDTASNCSSTSCKTPCGL